MEVMHSEVPKKIVTAPFPCRALDPFAQVAIYIVTLRQENTKAKHGAPSFRSLLPLS